MSKSIVNFLEVHVAATIEKRISIAVCYLKTVATFAVKGGKRTFQRVLKFILLHANKQQERHFESDSKSAIFCLRD